MLAFIYGSNPSNSGWGQGTKKLCNPSLLEIASATFIISVAWGVIRSLGDRREGHIGICLGPGPHRRAQGLRLCLTDGFHHHNLLKLAAWPERLDSALAGLPVILEHFPERKFLIREICSTEQSSPKPAIGFLVKGLLIKMSWLL